MNKYREEYCRENGLMYIKPENTSMNDYVEFLENKLNEAINYSQCSIQLKGGKYTQNFIDYVEKFFKYKPKVYEWVSKDGKREYTHKQLCKSYEKAMLESPFIV